MVSSFITEHFVDDEGRSALTEVDAPTLVRVQEALREDSTTLERWWRG
jgi:hypothetical protein